MPITSGYEMLIVIEVGMVAFDDLATTKAKAETFISSQITAGNIGGDSYSKSQYRGDPVSDVPHWLRMELRLDIADTSVVQNIRDAVVGALDTFDQVFEYKMIVNEKMDTWTAPA